MSRFGGGQLQGDLPEVLLKSITRTCMSCPAQWEGELLDGGFIYIRCRHGKFRATVGKDAPDPFGVVFIGGPIDELSLRILGYRIDDEPTTSEALKLIGGELVTAWEHDDLFMSKQHHKEH